MKKCPVCGKEFDVLWPELWGYRENGKFICTWKCLRQLRKEAEEKMYTKVKKNGEPAKKSGPKKAAEKAEKVTLVYDPSIAEEYQREQAEKKSFAEMKKPVPEEKKIQGQEPLEVYAIKSRVLKDGYYRKYNDGTGMFIYGLSVQQEQLGLRAVNWIRLSEEIRVALEQLGIRAEDPEDYTGNNGPL